MKVALIGSVSSSEACLEALIEGGVEVVGVLGLERPSEEPSSLPFVLPPWSPAALEGRGEEERSAQRTLRGGREVPNGPPVSDYRDLEPIARRAGIAFRAFRKITEPQVDTFLRGCRPDLLWVVGLSQLVPRSLIEIAPGGGVGFHPTMLPRGRGRAPVAWTILLGEPAAVSLFYLTDEPDAGDLIAQREVPVLPDDYSEHLIARTNVVLRDVVRELSPAIRSGVLPRRPQDHSLATYYAKRTPDDGLTDWSQSTDDIYRLIRAAGRPYPGAFTWVDGTKLIVWRARPESSEQLSAKERDASAGEVLRVEVEGALVRTADGALWITEAAGIALRFGMRLGVVAK